MDNITIDRGDAEPTVVTNSAAATSRTRSCKVQITRILVVALSGAALLQFQYVSKTEVLGRINMARDTISSQSIMVSGWVNHLPQVIDTRRTLLVDAVISPLTSTIKDAAGRAETVTAEGAGIVWERSQSFLRQLHSGADDNQRRRAPEENVLHRALEGLQGIVNRNKRDGGKKRVMKVLKNDQFQTRDDRQGHRRLMATEREEQQTPSNQDMGGLFLAVSSSPIAAVILIFCGIVFLIVSIAIASDDARRLRRLATSRENRTIVLDEEEAEIVEFYEKEMESGMMQSFHFLDEDDCHVDDCREDHADDERIRGQSIIRRPSSDSSLNRHLSETRVSQCDSYYSRVLQDITSFDEDEDDSGNEESSSVEGTGNKRQDELEAADPSPRDKAEEITAEGGAILIEEDEQLKTIATQCQNSDEDIDVGHPSSPPSSDSSISSLTSEVYADVESALPQQPQELGDISSSSQAGLTPRPIMTRKRRSVSFSPQVKVREIPRQVNSEMSSTEKYLYLMLFTVAIVITFCSLLPAPHPSLSVATSDLTAGELIQRADTILKSQWEVEL